MGKQAKAKGKPAVADGLDPIDPRIIFFTHSKIRSQFSGCGKSIQDTIDEVTSGALPVSAVPFITVLTSGDGHFYSLNNRRLYVLKYLRDNGYLEPSNTVRVRIKASLPREMKKYSPANCSLTATVMRERPMKTDADGSHSAGLEEEMDSVYLDSGDNGVEDQKDHAVAAIPVLGQQQQEKEENVAAEVGIAATETATTTEAVGDEVENSVHSLVEEVAASVSN